MQRVARKLEVIVDPPLYLRPTPVLIGRPEARQSKATGCAVYQLTSAYRTKEQQSGWRASASSPSEFSFSFFLKHPAQLLGDRKRRTVCYLLKGDNCIVGSTLAERSRREDWEDLWADTRFTRSWQLKLAASRRHNAASLLLFCCCCSRAVRVSA